MRSYLVHRETHHGHRHLPNRIRIQMVSSITDLVRVHRRHHDHLENLERLNTKSFSPSL